jgi:hypothetical protein
VSGFSPAIVVSGFSRTFQVFSSRLGGMPMTADRYTKLLLTVIALELGWIALSSAGVQVSAQRSEPTPVIIRGVEGPPGKEVYIPVTLVGATATVQVAADRPLEIQSRVPIRIQADRPIPVETTDRPLLIRTVSDPPAARPGVN